MKNNIFLIGTHWGDEGNGKVVDVTNEPKQVKERAFHINIKGSGGLKWLNKSQNKTWVNGNKVYRMKEGDPTNQ